jgi:hypothetical protein
MPKLLQNAVGRRCYSAGDGNAGTGGGVAGGQLVLLLEATATP